MFGNLLKAVVGVVTLPVAVVVDVVTAPGSAYDGKDAFHRTDGIAKDIGKNVKKALAP